jgi:hypothetical protein
MSYRIVITRDAPNAPGECVVETVDCTSKQDLDAKYIALTKRIGRDILGIKVEHSDDDKVGKA